MAAERPDLVGKRATVMGLGTRGGGVGVARYLANAGALVTVTDAKPAEALAGPLAELAGLPITYVLNNLNRGLGNGDAYPFVLSNAAVDKLRFVHETVARRGG